MIGRIFAKGHEDFSTRSDFVNVCRNRRYYQGRIADNLSEAGWSWGCVSALDSRGRTIFVADLPRSDKGERFALP
jgi:hypothetical protein